MKKNLQILTLAGMATLFGGISAYATGNAWFFKELGETMGVSDNGLYVAISDVDNLRGYVWDNKSPDTLKDITIRTTETNLPSSQTITGVSVMDFSDNGMGVGSVYYKDGNEKAAYYENGEWKFLPIHEFSINLTQAVAVTPDGKVIAGLQFIKDEASDIKGRFYPCQWIRNDLGEYDMICYTDLDLPDHQGFYTLTQNNDGTIIGGRLYCAAGSEIPVLLNNGVLQYFNKLETRIEPFEYKGEILNYYEEYYIDGYHDGATGDYFSGEFRDCDENGNFYGFRTRAMNVTEDGRGNLVTGACIYNVNTKEWIDSEDYLMYTTGIGTDLLFNSDASVIENGQAKSLTDAYELDPNHTLTAIAKISKDARVLGGMWQEFNPATGEYSYYPFVVELAKAPESGVTAVMDANRNLILVSAGRIDTVNDTEAEIFTIDGKMAGRGTSVNVTPGIYVVKIGETSTKVAVH